MSKQITVFGGSGFLGQYVVRELLSQGHRIKLVSRNPQTALACKVVAPVGKLALIAGDIHDENFLRSTIRHSDTVINLVGILFEHNKQTFASLHSQAAENIALISKEEKVKQLIHISALGVDHATKSKYARTKILGEKAVLSAFPEVVIIRPSVMYGMEDNFFNLFAKILSFSPIMPLIGAGKTHFQPVYVKDVAIAIATIIKKDIDQGQLYELGGPDVVSFKQLLQFIANILNKKRYFIHLPFFAAKIQASFMELFPTPLLTRDQVELLKTDNIVSEKQLTFTDLGIAPKSFYNIVPQYLKIFR